MIRSLAFATLALATVPAIAQILPALPAPPAVEKKVCRSNGLTGTRMGGRERTCHTVAEWKVLDGKAATDESRSPKANMSGSRGY